MLCKSLIFQWLKRYLNEVGRKPPCSAIKRQKRFKGYLNEVGGKPLSIRVKRYLNKVDRKRVGQRTIWATQGLKSI